jgi:dihydroxyacetone kinase
MRELTATSPSVSAASTPANTTQSIDLGLTVKGNYTTAVYTQPQAIDAVWTLASAGFIFLMQAGFAFVESGAVSKKNRSAMLIKNLYNVFIAAIAFWLSGYGLAFANP